jgi:hypothetical protein
MKKRVCMNWVQPLNLFEKKLQTFSVIEKLQLYLIPIVLSVFIIYNFMNIQKEIQPTLAPVLEKNNVNSFDFLKDLQEFTKNKDLTLLNIKQSGLKFSVQIEGDFLNIMQFLLFCEHYKSINTFYDFKLSSNATQKTLLLDFELATNKYEANEYDKLIALLLTLKNPFKEWLTLQNDEGLKLNAIINDEVLINDVWHKLGNIFLGYTLFEIHQHFVILKKSNGEERTLHLIKE